MALETMRRYLTPDEDTSLEDVDAKTPEEAEAELAGVSVSDWRDLAKPEKGPMAALDRATFAARNPVGPPTAEESDARLAGMSLSQWRDLAKPEKGPMAALDRATFAARNPVGPPTLEAAPVPTKSASLRVDAPVAAASTQPAVTSTSPAGKPDSSDKDGMVAPSSEGAGGDTSERDLYLARLAAQNAAGFGSMGAGKNIDMGIADTLGERLKQVQALRAKREEKEVTDAQEVANNKAQVDYLISRFPEQTDSLTKLYGMTRKANFPQFVRLEEQIALDRAKKQDIGAKAEDRAKTQEYRAGTLDLKRDIAKDNRDYRAVQAGLKQSELNLRAAENERKATGSAEPSDKERSAFQASMKPAEKTAVALRDADTLNSLGEGMLVTGKPPAFLSRSDIAAFNGIPFGQVSRSQLAQSNPQAYDLLTKMAEIKTIIGHEYFGSALSPAEAERQRQFMDFGALDTPDSIAGKMKNYRETLANRATVFLRPRVLGRPLGNEWAQSTGLDAISGEGGTFAGLLDAPKGAAPKAAEVKEPAAVEGKVRMLSPDNRVAKIPAAEVEARKAQGWKEAP